MDELVGGCRVAGVRLPELMRYLARCTPDPEGGNLVELPRALLTVAPAEAGPLERAFLQAIREDPDDDASWNAYSDWLQERGEPPAGLHTLRRALTWAGRWYDAKHEGRLGPRADVAEDLASAARAAEQGVAALERDNRPSRSLVHVGEHVAQLCLHYDRWKTPRRELDIYHEWIYFDDLWASAHLDLANTILRYVRRWDVLSTSRRPR